MPKYIGDKPLKARYVGDRLITKIYRGASLVWEAIKDFLVQISGKSMALVNCTREESLNDFKIYGKSDQKKYQGYNLYDNLIPNISTQSNTSKSERTATGFKQSEFTGTNTDRVVGGADFLNVIHMPIDSEKTYTLKYDFDTSVNVKYMRTLASCFNANGERLDFEPNSLEQGVKFTVSASWGDVKKGSVSIVLKFPTDAKFASFRFGLTNSGVLDSGAYYEYKNIMLLEGTQTGVKPYEPYVGGIPSPNPDYPQEIKSIKNPNVLISGKNLVDSNVFLYQYGTTVNNGIISIRDTSGWGQAYCMFGSQITAKSVVLSFKQLMHGEITSNFGLAVLVRAFDKDGNNVSESATIADSNIPSWYRSYNSYYQSIRLSLQNYFELTDIAISLTISGCDYFCVGLSGYAGYDSLVNITDLQVEDGLTSTDYESFHEPQSYVWNHTLYGIPVSSDGNYTDKSGQQWIADYVDVENKKLWHMVGYERFDEIQFVRETNDYKGRYVTDEIMQNSYKLYTVPCISNLAHFQGYAVGGIGYGICTYGKYLMIWTGAPDAIDEANQTFKGKEFEVIGALSVPYSEDLTDAEVEAFKQLKTFKPTTIVTNDQGAYMSTSYHTDRIVTYSLEDETDEDGEIVEDEVIDDVA